MTSSNRTPDRIEIQLTQGRKTLVDPVDADLADIRWHVTGQCYVYRFLDWRTGHAVLLHRVILARMLGRELGSSELVDHANRDPLDNRRKNLRVATKADNQRNQKRKQPPKSGLKGAYQHRGGRWYSRIRIGHKSINLGTFESAEEAHRAYCDAAKKYHGEFASFG